MTSLEFEERIKAIKQEAIDSEGEEFWYTYFLNFTTRLPGGFMRMILSGKPVMSQPFRDWVQENYQEDSSDLYLRQTPEEFFATIDKILQELGITDQVLKFQAERLKSLAPLERRELNRQFHDLVLPVYVRLSDMGYSSYDLVS